MDKIILQDLQFYGFHGLFPEEKKLGQRFLVDMELYLDLKKSGKTDDMNDSIDYGQVFELVRKVVEGEPKNLIEALAEQIAQETLAAYTSLHACLVRVKKPDPPIPGHYKSVAVEIYREKMNE